MTFLPSRRWKQPPKGNAFAVCREQRPGQRHHAGSVQDSGMLKTPAFMKCANLLVDVQSASSFRARRSPRRRSPTIAMAHVTNHFQVHTGKKRAGSINVVRIMYIRNRPRKARSVFDLSTMSEMAFRDCCSRPHYGVRGADFVPMIRRLTQRYVAAGDRRVASVPAVPGYDPTLRAPAERFCFPAKYRKVTSATRTIADLTSAIYRHKHE